MRNLLHFSYVEYYESEKNLKSLMQEMWIEQNMIDFGRGKIHRDLVDPLNSLIAEAAEAGFDFAVASGFRSVERQCLIWNAKASGTRPVMGDDGIPLDIHRLTPEQRLFAILRWSALPGTSRHHWGTDIDVYDRAALPEGSVLQLTVEECQGPFAAFHAWLDSRLAAPDAEFFRPYVRSTGGVAPEPWHLSFAPIAARYQQSLTKEQLRAFVASLEIELKEVVLLRFDEIYERFIWVPWDLYPSTFYPPHARHL